MDLGPGVRQITVAAVTSGDTTSTFPVIEMPEMPEAPTVEVEDASLRGASQRTTSHIKIL